MNIIVKPIISEKMTRLSEKLGCYAFVVDRSANKLQIKEAVESMYGVQVEAVNTIIHGGKRKSRFTKTGIIAGKTATYKKALVTLAKGENIDFYSNI